MFQFHSFTFSLQSCKKCGCTFVLFSNLTCKALIILSIVLKPSSTQGWNQAMFKKKIREVKNPVATR